MSLTVAVIASLLISAVSGGVGWYLRRYQSAVTEMLGMMIGMTFGMMTGIAVGYYIGAATDMFVSNLVGVLVGLGFGVVFGRVGGLMGMMDGGMGGMMGGMMGAMLGVMVNISETAVSVTAAWLTKVGLPANQSKSWPFSSRSSAANCAVIAGNFCRNCACASCSTWSSRLFR